MICVIDDDDGVVGCCDDVEVVFCVIDVGVDVIGCVCDVWGVCGCVVCGGCG